MLPTLLKPGALRSQEQRKEFRQTAGIDGLGDIGRLIEGLPEEFLQLLRISAVLRPIANSIGATNEDRLRINATYAYQVCLDTHVLVQCIVSSWPTVKVLGFSPLPLAKICLELAAESRCKPSFSFLTGPLGRELKCTSYTEALHPPGEDVCNFEGSAGHALDKLCAARCV